VNKPIRVMLCDDSSVMRRLLKGALTATTEFEVVYEAENGQLAVDNVGRIRPDIVVLDVEMPVMDGIDTARTLRRRYRTLPIIMFSSLTSQGASATMEALAAGANDFAIKPAGTNNFKDAQAKVQGELVSKIRNLVSTPDDVQEKLGAPKSETVSHVKEPLASTSQRRKIPAAPVVKAAPFSGAHTSADGSGKGKVSVVAIGVSTGGPEALSRLITKLPKPFPVPILITQHMPPVFTGLLAERLSLQSEHRVREAGNGDTVVAGEILIAPGDFHLTVIRDKTKVRTVLDQSPPENSCRPSVDPLFRSVSKVYGRETLAVVLTGMGSDGGEGSRVVKQMGGRVFAQDEASSVVWGMPGYVASNGLADRVLPVEQIATELVRAVESKLQPVCV
jgi:two-component system, chemotaxis family, protein-glutamate methylesterase/glutaminase